MKYSRKVRKCAKKMINVAALVNQDTVKEIVEEKNKSITRLHMQLETAIEEADAKVTQNVALTKELGQVKQELKEAKANLEVTEKENVKVKKSNDCMAKELNVITDNVMALRQENIQLERQIIEKDNKLLEKDKLLQEKDDLIRELKTPWYRRIFKHGTIQD